MEIPATTEMLQLMGDSNLTTLGLSLICLLLFFAFSSDYEKA